MLTLFMSITGGIDWSTVYEPLKPVGLQALWLMNLYIVIGFFTLLARSFLPGLFCFVCVLVCVFVCLFVCLFVCVSAWLLVCLFACLFVCLFVCLFSVEAFEVELWAISVFQSDEMSQMSQVCMVFSQGNPTSDTRNPHAVSLPFQSGPKDPECRDGCATWLRRCQGRSGVCLV